jgi:hypothetical protein
VWIGACSDLQIAVRATDGANTGVAIRSGYGNDLPDSINRLSQQKTFFRNTFRLLFGG